LEGSFVADRLALRKVCKVYPGGNVAVKDVTFTTEPGTFLVLLGPSGSGKTTLLRTIAGIERTSAGTIVIGETEVAGERTHRPPEQRDLSMVFQDYALWPHLSVTDNVAFALRRRNHSRSECRRLATGMLERVGLVHLSDRYPGQLSGGEQQRVALARALVGDTGLLLCDEPLSNLDADLRDRMRVEISSLVREVGATTIYITHDQQEAFALADQIGVMSHGELVQLGTPEEVYANPATRFVARFTGLAGELRVRISGEPSLLGTVSVQPELPTLGQPIEAFWSQGEPASEFGTLTIRPGAVRLCDPQDPAAQLQGQVADVAFRGRSYELAVDLQGGGRLNGVHSERRACRVCGLPGLTR
jgi:iron(III) transport system ATP-binding protein